MALKEYQLLYLDNDIPINRSFYCNNGDIKSRGLEVHVLDNSQAKDCTGLTLKMIIKVPSGDLFEATVENGLVTVLNAASGIYQVLFPDNMGKGRLIAEIQLSNTVPEIIVSRKFSLVSDGSLTSDGSISELPKAGILWDVIKNEAQRQADFIGVLGSLDAEVATKYAELETTYAPELNLVKSQLAESVSQMQAQVNVIVANATVDTEVILARGTDVTLKARLDESDAILTVKADKTYVDTNLDNIANNQVSAINPSIIFPVKNSKIIVDVAESTDASVTVKHGRKNKIPFPYYHSSGRTSNGITFTVNPDGSIVANGTATANAVFMLTNSNAVVLDPGTYVISGAPIGSNFGLNYQLFCTGLEAYDQGFAADKTIAVQKACSITIAIYAGYVANNLKFYPQLEFGDMPSKYSPYTGSDVSYTVPIAGGIGSVELTAYDDTNTIYTNADSLNVKYSKATKRTEVELNSIWEGKKILCIGDSLSAANKWQKIMRDKLKCNYVNRVLGGAGILTLINGGTTANGTISALTANDVTGIDAIVLYAGYNDRSTLKGVVGDLYPANNTIAGLLQYALDTIYALLTTAKNTTCKILVVTPHCVGTYAYIPQTGYQEYPIGSGQTLKDICNTMVDVANNNNCRALNLWKVSGIGKNTWSTYSAIATDQVHLNPLGYRRVGEVITAEIELV